MKILIVDDHALIRSGLKQICAELGGPVYEADKGDTALALQRAHRPEFIILDLNLPGVSGLDLLRKLCEGDPAARILIFSVSNDPFYASRALRIGAKGYASKNTSPDELRTAILRVSGGQTYVEGEMAQKLVARASEPNDLSDRDLDILRLLGDGRSFNEIAFTLNVGYKTVANAATLIKNKLGVARTADLIRLSVEMRMSKGL